MLGGEMSKTADKYISQGGRTDGYSRSDYVDDLATLSCFLAWAEEDGAFYGMTEARDAFKAACRLLDVDSVKLRNVAKGGPPQ